MNKEGETLGTQPRRAATIGFFDGVHRGHQHLLQELRQVAVRQELEPLVVTFANHPRQVVQQGWKPQLLTTAAEKTMLLQREGIAQVAMMTFDADMARLSAREFMLMLRQRYGVRLLLIGYDNRFGHGRKDRFEDYVAYGREWGIEVVQAAPYEADGQRFSSSMVRSLLTEGDVSGAARCLGRYYSLSGLVVHGEHIGHTLGFPTANLQSDEPLKIVPRTGVYAVLAAVHDAQQHAADGTLLRGVMNIGRRPTFDGRHLTLETHLLDFDADLYGRRLTLHFVARLRDELPFADATALAHQMTLDVQQASQLFTIHPQHSIQ